jgi:two-component sensor histidine kinase
MLKARLLALIISMQFCFVGDTNAQIINRQSYTMVQPASHYDSIDMYLFIFPVLANGVIDSSTAEMNKKMRNHTFKKSMKEISRADYDSLSKVPRTDSVIFVLDRVILKNMNDSYWFRIWMDGSLFKDWKQVDFSDKNRIGNYAVLHKTSTKYHLIYFEVSDHDRKPRVTLKMTNYSSIPIWGVYRNERITKVKDVVRAVNKIDYSTINIYPESNCEAGFAVGKIDTYKGAYRQFMIPRSVTSLPSDSLLFLLGNIADSDQYEFRLTESNQEVSTIKWKKNGKGNNLLQLSGLKPGNYTLIFRFSSDFDRFNEYRFTVIDQTKWYRKAWFNWIFGSLVSGLSFLLMFIAYRRVQRGATREREEKLKMTSLQLQVYRSQLNPHFIFNALSSIQSLVNKNDNTQANRYLTDFSALLRMTLDQQKAEFWTLQEEAELLQKYIGLEQLRFRFQYEIETDNKLEPGDIAFPSMLLQPIVENAIKHGISGNYENGKLVISFNGRGNDLEITVSDNGQGFDATLPVVALHGISLTKERIAFINELNKTQKITLDIKSSSTGTMVHLKFQHFL